MQDICKKVFKIKIDLTPKLVNPTSGIGPKGTNKLVLIAPVSYTHLTLPTTPYV